MAITHIMTERHQLNISSNGCRAIAFFFLFAGLTHSLTANGTWTPITPINLEQMTGSAYTFEPRLDSDTSGGVMALWRSDIRESNFNRLAVAFSPTKGLSYGGATYLNFDDAPALNGDVAYAGNGIWVIVATRNEESYRKGIFFRSFDNGRTWTPPSFLTPEYVDAKISLDSDKNGTLIASAGSAIFRSTDYGETWERTPPIVPREGEYWTSPVGVVKSLVTTNGQGKWVHTFLRFEDYGRRFAYHALTSTDNGINWENVFEQEVEPASPEYRDPVLEDVCISGDDVVIAATVDGLTGLFISRTGGSTWSEFTQFATIGTRVAIAAQGAQWQVLAGAYSRQGSWNIFSSNNLEDWEFTKLPGLSIGDTPALTEVSGGGFAALCRASGIAGMTCGVSAQEASAPDLAISFISEPEAKDINKKGIRRVTAKISVSNVGNVASERTIVKCWLSDYYNRFEYPEPKFISIKPFKALKVGKKPKTKTVKIRFDCANGARPDIIHTEIMQSYNELNPANNLDANYFSY